jgi:hypothetical protein
MAQEVKREKKNRNCKNEQVANFNEFKLFSKMKMNFLSTPTSEWFKDF